MAKCDEMKCSEEERKECLAQYDENGKFVGTKKACCSEKAETDSKL